MNATRCLSAYILGTIAIVPAIVSAQLNGVADNTIDSLGYYTQIQAGARQGTRSAYLSDDPTSGLVQMKWTIDAGYAGSAFAIGGAAGDLFSNAGAQSEYTNDATAWAYSMHNNYDLIYGTYFEFAGGVVTSLTAGFRSQYVDLGAVPADDVIIDFIETSPFLQYGIDIFSVGADGLPAVADFTGDVFSTDYVPGTWSLTPTGVIYTDALNPAATYEIMALTYTLATPWTLAPGQYYFVSDAAIVPEPSTVGALAVVALVGFVAARRRFVRR